MIQITAPVRNTLQVDDELSDVCNIWRDRHTWGWSEYICPVLTLMSSSSITNIPVYYFALSTERKVLFHCYFRTSFPPPFLPFVSEIPFVPRYLDIAVKVWDGQFSWYFHSCRFSFNDFRSPSLITVGIWPQTSWIGRCQYPLQIRRENNSARNIERLTGWMVLGGPASIQSQMTIGDFRVLETWSFAWTNVHISDSDVPAIHCARSDKPMAADNTPLWTGFLLRITPKPQYWELCPKHLPLSSAYIDWRTSESWCRKTSEKIWSTQLRKWPNSDVYDTGGGERISINLVNYSTWIFSWTLTYPLREGRNTVFFWDERRPINRSVFHNIHYFVNLFHPEDALSKSQLFPLRALIFCFSGIFFQSLSRNVFRVNHGTGRKFPSPISRPTPKSRHKPW